MPARRRYADVGFGRFAERYGMPFGVNPHFLVNTLMLRRGAAGVQRRMGEKRLQDCLRSVLRALWIEPRSSSDPACIAAALTAAGFEPADVLALSNEPVVKARRRATRNAAVERGAFGAPRLFAGDRMYFGQDRLDFIARALRA